MIPIQVLGTGLIPRGYGLAPRKEPFKADKTLIATIMSTPGLTVNFVNPDTGAITKLTRTNIERIYQKWSGYNPKKPAPQVVHTHPAAPVKPANPVKAQDKGPFQDETNQDKVSATLTNARNADQVTGLNMDSLIGAPLRPETASFPSTAMVPPPTIKMEEETVSFSVSDSTKKNMEENFAKVQGVGSVPVGKIDQPEEIAAGNVPEGMVLGIPAELSEDAQDEATLITVTENGSEVTTVPEEPVESVGYVTPDAGGEADTENGDVVTVTATSEPTELDKAVDSLKNASFKPILSEDEKPATPKPTNSGSVKSNPHKNHHKNHR